jgi:phosphoglycolate phosphatase
VLGKLFRIRIWDGSMISANLDAFDYLMGHRVAIFDVDDTLIFTFETAFARTCAALDELGLGSIDKRDFADVYGVVPFPDCVHRWHPDLELATFQAAYAKRSPALPYRPTISISHLFRSLVRASIQVGIVTNSARGKLERKLGRNCLSLLPANYVWCRENLLALKPSPAAFDGMLCATGLPPAAHVYVGDSMIDAEASRGAGLGFIAVESGPHDWRGNAPHIFRSLVDLVELIGGDGGVSLADR